MASFIKIEAFVEHLTNKVHDLFGSGGGIDDIKVYLTNATVTPDTHAVKADIAEISAGNGYTAGGVSVTPVGSRSGGTYTLSGTKVVIVASGGSIGPFRHVILYNDTPTSPADPLMGGWDYGSALTLNDGESFSVKFNNSETTGEILTIA